MNAAAALPEHRRRSPFRPLGVVLLAFDQCHAEQYTHIDHSICKSSKKTSRHNATQQVFRRCADNVAFCQASIDNMAFCLQNVHGSDLPFSSLKINLVNDCTEEKKNF